MRLVFTPVRGRQEGRARDDDVPDEQTATSRAALALCGIDVAGRGHDSRDCDATGSRRRLVPPVERIAARSDARRIRGSVGYKLVGYRTRRWVRVHDDDFDAIVKCSWRTRAAFMSCRSAASAASLTT